MKKILFTILLLVPFLGFAQKLEKDSESGRYSTQQVLDMPGKSKSELYKKMMEWIALNYQSANDVVQLSDAESGKIILKGSYAELIFFKERFIRHTLIFDFKDDKLRYTYTNFSIYDSGTDTPLEGSLVGKKGIIFKAEERIKGSIQSLQDYIITAQAKNEDW